MNGKKWNGARNLEESILLRSDQRSCEHTLTALSSLMAMFAPVMTLVLEMARKKLRPLLSLLIHALLCSNMMTGQRFRNKKVDRKTNFDEVGGWGSEVLVLVFPSPSHCELLLRTVR